MTLEEEPVDDAVKGRSSADEAADGYRLCERAVMFGLAFAFWLLMAWPMAPAEGRPLWADIAAGALVAGFVALVSPGIMTQRFGRLIEPARYFWAFVFLFVFAYYVVIANLDVAYRVLHPSMPIRPGIVRASTMLRTATARTVLANCITLTPGTVTVKLDGDDLIVHAISAKAAEGLEGEMERRIKAIFEPEDRPE